MTGTKISGLPGIATPQLTDTFPVVQSGITYQESVTQLFSLISPSQITWQTVTSTPINALVNHGYITNSGSQIQITLPAVFVIGDIIEIRGLGAGGWIILPNGGQTIQFASVTASTSIQSDIQFSNLTLRGIVANTTWTVDLTNSNPIYL